ncbi:hypothetical protein NDU88_001814 [Pleurodeles waltl]|uniref:Uncharacterized protein n=1 Tax=Pleurodeles waltl TaxID=8319 RepID=A0AAV7VCK6_PLEWA|nr:hypothetical protein NDU88_001814 [Pleurodeles waltl]
MTRVHSLVRLHRVCIRRACEAGFFLFIADPLSLLRAERFGLGLQFQLLFSRSVGAFICLSPTLARSASLN